MADPNFDEGLPPDVRAVIDAADRADVAGDALRQRAWDGLTTSLGPAAAHAKLGASLSAGATGATGLTGVAVALAAVAAAAVALVPLAWASSPTSSPVASAPISTMPPPPPPPMTTTVLRAHATHATDATPATPVRAKQRADDGAGERVLIEDARAALARGSSDDAARALAKHTGEYPAGALVEDREALRVLVALRRGSADAAELERDFRSRWPDSVYRAVIERTKAQRPATATLKDPGAAPQSSL